MKAAERLPFFSEIVARCLLTQCRPCRDSTAFYVIFPATPVAGFHMSPLRDWNINQPLVPAMRAASTRFAAPSFLIASDKEFKNDRDQCKFVSCRRWQLSSRPGVQKILEIFSRSRGMPFDSLAKGREAQSRCNTFC